MERDLEDAEAEERTLEAHGGEWNPDFVEQLLAIHRSNGDGASALHHLHQHRRRRLADRATAALELHLFDRVAILGERNEDRDLVPTKRVQTVGLRVRLLHLTVAARVLVVVEYDVAIELIHVAHLNTSRTLWTPATSRST